MFPLLLAGGEIEGIEKQLGAADEDSVFAASQVGEDRVVSRRCGPALLTLQIKGGDHAIETCRKDRIRDDDWSRPDPIAGGGLPREGSAVSINAVKFAGGGAEVEFAFVQSGWRKQLLGAGFATVELELPAHRAVGNIEGVKRAVLRTDVDSCAIGHWRHTQR